MNKRVLTLAAFLLVLFSVAMLATFIFAKKFADRAGNLSCTGDYHLFQDQRRLSMSIDYSAKNGDGMLVVSGYYQDATHPRMPIALKRTFGYHVRQNYIQFYNQKDSFLSLSPELAPLLSGLLPKFFLRIQQDDVYPTKIKRVTSKIWLFSSASEPYFICEAN